MRRKNEIEKIRADYMHRHRTTRHTLPVIFLSLWAVCFSVSVVYWVISLILVVSLCLPQQTLSTAASVKKYRYCPFCSVILFVSR